jgi:hypothetical protein
MENNNRHDRHVFEIFLKIQEFTSTVPFSIIHGNSQREGTAVIHISSYILL